jgi:hypothetical protein
MWPGSADYAAAMPEPSGDEGERGGESEAAEVSE